MESPPQQQTRPDLFTRRQFMIYGQVIAGHADLTLAEEVVTAWAADHPDVDMDEQLTWSEWAAQS